MGKSSATSTANNWTRVHSLFSTMITITRVVPVPLPSLIDSRRHSNVPVKRFNVVRRAILPCPFSFSIVPSINFSISTHISANLFSRVHVPHRRWIIANNHRLLKQLHLCHIRPHKPPPQRIKSRSTRIRWHTSSMVYSSAVNQMLRIWKN